jgi:hypothetical protein
MSPGIKRNREVAEELKDVAETMGTMTGSQLAVATAMTKVEEKMNEVHLVLETLIGNVNSLEEATIGDIEAGVQTIADTVEEIISKMMAVTTEMDNATSSATDMVEWGEVVVQEEVAKIHAARKRMHNSNNSMLQSQNARKKTTKFMKAAAQGAKAMASAIEMMVGLPKYGVVIAHDMLRAQLTNGMATREDETYLAKVLGVDTAARTTLEQGYAVAKAHNPYFAENAMVVAGSKKPAIKATAGNALKHVWRELPVCSNATSRAMNRIMADALNQMQAKWQADAAPDDVGMIGMDEVRAFMTCNLMHHNLNDYDHHCFGGRAYQEPTEHDIAGPEENEED